MRFLVVIETPKVNPYLFSSPWLNEMRGAGVILELLNRREIKALPKEIRIKAYERIFLGGGSGRFLFESNQDAERFKSAVMERYHAKTVNAPVAVQILARSTAQSFPEWVSEGVNLARLDIAGHPKSLSAPVGRWARPCSSCGTELAGFVSVQHGDPRLCPVCAVKRDAAEKIYSTAKHGKKGYRPSESAHNLARHHSNKFILTNLAQYSELDGCSVYLPQSFEAIGEVSRPSGLMGFIYANGNRMSEFVKNLGSICRNDEEAKRAYRAFSEITDKATREAAVEAVLEHVDIRTENDWDRFIPAEFITAGCDDLILVVPAHNALDVATHFMRTFQKKTLTLQQHYMDKNDLQGFFAPKGMTASAGIVFSHVHYPVRDLVALAGDLLKRAKAKSAALSQKSARDEPGGEEIGTLDFMVFSHTGSEPLKEISGKKYERSGTGDKPVVLTERPYTCTEAESLLQTIRALKADGVTRSRLKPLHSAAFQEPARAQAEALTIKKRLKKSGILAEGSALDKLLAGLSRLPFRENVDGTWSTPLPEILEIYDFIQPGSRASSGMEGD